MTDINRPQSPADCPSPERVLLKRYEERRKKAVGSAAADRLSLVRFQPRTGDANPRTVWKDWLVIRFRCFFVAQQVRRYKWRTTREAIYRGVCETRDLALIAGFPEDVPMETIKDYLRRPIGSPYDCIEFNSRKSATITAFGVNEAMEILNTSFKIKRRQQMDNRNEEKRINRALEKAQNPAQHMAIERREVGPVRWLFRQCAKNGITKPRDWRELSRIQEELCNKVMAQGVSIEKFSAAVDATHEFFAQGGGK